MVSSTEKHGNHNKLDDWERAPNFFKFVCIACNIITIYVYILCYSSNIFKILYTFFTDGLKVVYECFESDHKISEDSKFSSVLFFKRRFLPLL